MDIQHKLYPYPVLSGFTDDYVNSNFEMDCIPQKGIRELNFSITFTLKNDEMQKLIYNDLAEYVVHIECPYTAYRTVIKSKEAIIEKKISEHKLNGKVSICGFIIAKKDIPKFKNSSFNEDYNEMQFNINRGNILAVAGKYIINITKETEELAKIPSIFTICKCAEDTDESMKFDISGEKIAITLCQESFDNYKILSSTPNMLPIIHSMLIVPALIYTFETLKKEGLDEFIELRWFKSIEKALEKNEMELNEKLLDSYPSYELAQKVLDIPINRAFSALISLDSSEDEEE